VHLVIPNQAEGPVRNLLFLAGCPIQASLWLEWGFQTLKTFPSIQRRPPALDVIPNARAFTSGQRDLPHHEPSPPCSADCPTLLAFFAKGWETTTPDFDPGATSGRLCQKSGFDSVKSHRADSSTTTASSRTPALSPAGGGISPTTDLAPRVETPKWDFTPKSKRRSLSRASPREFFSLFPEYQINPVNLDISQTL
jgi:hypothetical protein